MQLYNLYDYRYPFMIPEQSKCRSQSSVEFALLSNLDSVKVEHLNSPLSSDLQQEEAACCLTAEWSVMVNTANFTKCRITCAWQ